MNEKTMKISRGPAITQGSGDVSTGLSFSPAESRNLPLRSHLRLRSQLTTARTKFIQNEGLTQSGDSCVEVDLRIQPPSRRVAWSPSARVALMKVASHSTIGGIPSRCCATRGFYPTTRPQAKHE